jgi:hypothetical protein
LELPLLKEVQEDSEETVDSVETEETDSEMVVVMVDGDGLHPSTSTATELRMDGPRTSSTLRNTERADGLRDLTPSSNPMVLPEL